MKRLLTILLMGLLTFNWVGYRLLTDFLQHRSDRQLEAKLDRQAYDEADLIEIRVPINMPYINDSKEFERVDGEITLGDVQYKYVQRRVEKGELVLKCIPHESRMEIQTARDRFFALVNDLEQKAPSGESKAPSTHAFKSLFTEYWEQPPVSLVHPFAALKPQHALADLDYLLSSVLFPPAQPPDQFC